MLQDVVDEYLISLSLEGASREGVGEGIANQNTVVAYRNDLTQFSAYLTRQQIQNWPAVACEHVAGYLLEMREHQGYRPATIARKLAALKAFFRYLRTVNLIISDPLANLETPHIHKEPPHTLDRAEVHRLFSQVDSSHAAGKRDLAMLHMLYATGMRVGEMVSLDLADFHSEQATVLCPGRQGRSKRERVLPLAPIVVETIEHYLNEARPQLVNRHPELQALFLNHHGERLTRQGFWLIIKGYARQAGILDITPHSLRHSFAVSMLRDGMELRSVQELLGHAHISTTQVYSQVATKVSITPI
jgi:integrase/recombinase XerD